MHSSMCARQGHITISTMFIQKSWGKIVDGWSVLIMKVSIPISGTVRKFINLEPVGSKISNTV
jgi:hypothetical protein